MPVLASVFAASGWTLIAIPLLPAPPSRRDSDTAKVAAADARVCAAHHPVAPTLESRPLRDGQGGGTPGGYRPSGSTPATPSRRPIGRRRRSWSPRDHKGTTVPVHPRRYRIAATLVLMAWGCGSMLLLLNLARNYWLIRRLRRASSPMRNASLQAAPG